MTNYERIKNMNIDEIAVFLNNIATCCNHNGYYNKQMFCKECPINRGGCSFVDFGCWLNSEVEE